MPRGHAEHARARRPTAVRVVDALVARPVAEERGIRAGEAGARARRAIPARTAVRVRAAVAARRAHVRRVVRRAGRGNHTERSRGNRCPTRRRHTSTGAWGSRREETRGRDNVRSSRRCSRCPLRRAQRRRRSRMRRSQRRARGPGMSPALRCWSGTRPAKLAASAWAQVGVCDASSPASSVNGGMDVVASGAAGVCASGVTPGGDFGSASVREPASGSGRRARWSPPCGRRMRREGGRRRSRGGKKRCRVKGGGALRRPCPRASAFPLQLPRFAPLGPFDPLPSAPSSPPSSGTRSRAIPFARVGTPASSPALSRRGPAAPDVPAAAPMPPPKEEDMGQNDRELDVSRRNLGALLGVLGGAAGLAALGGCMEAAGAQETEATATTAQALSGSQFLWVDSIVTVSAADGGADGGAGSGANLRSVTGTDSSSASRAVAVVGGYYAPNDGGGGLFYWSNDTATPDDGGTVIVPAPPTGGVRTGCWRRIFSGPFNVKWFGARGDLSAPDDAAIQATISAAGKAAVQYDCRVRLVPGRHVHDHEHDHLCRRGRGAQPRGRARRYVRESGRLAHVVRRGRRDDDGGARRLASSVREHRLRRTRRRRDLHLAPFESGLPGRRRGCYGSALSPLHVSERADGYVDEQRYMGWGHGHDQRALSSSAIRPAERTR